VVNEVSLADVVGGMPSQEPQRRSLRSSERRQKKRRRRTVVVLLVSLVVIGGGLAGAWVGFVQPLVRQFTAPTDYPGPGGGAVEVTVPDGASGTAIGQLLREKDVVMTVDAFVEAVGADPQGASIRPGTYSLKTRMKASDAVTALLSEKNRLLARATLKEGVRVADVPALVAQVTKIPLADLQTAIKTPGALGLPPEAKGDLEGWLFPATYDVAPTDTAASLLRQMVQRTIQEMDTLGVPAASRRSVLIKASMVQAEAMHAEDFPKIARVLENRLARKIPLQLDTTVHYATKKFTITTSIKDTQVNSPYNTYKVPALPIGPIGNPGTAAIKAVLAPSAGPWLYFVATNPDTGLTEYATTEAEFQVIKAKYEAWARANPGK
jgi:UPF0755 protein